MLDVALLGTGGMMPLPKRWLTSCMMRYNGSNLLIDCGEGTQIALRELGWSCKPIDAILITHFHADHIAGLPGLLLTMGNSDRKEPVTIYGPKGIERIVRAARTFAPELPFETRFVEIQGNEQTFEISGLSVTAFRVNHRVLCYSYEVQVHRGGRFDVEKAKAANIPLKLWSPLQKGAVIEYEGRTLTPDMVLGETRRGLKVVYSTDTRPTPDIVSHAEDADLLILEGMYGDHEKDDDARQKKHMTMPEAAEIARKAQPKELWFTHYSPSLIRPDQYMDEIRKIFPQAEAPRDGRNTSLAFDDEEEQK
ncbi:MAG: ribonuclease Z [Lachnospiraceae bacterium]|nr:ribonuclease Z [Lachnospiraceae bacterium]